MLPNCSSKFSESGAFYTGRLLFLGELLSNFKGALSSFREDNLLHKQMKSTNSYFHAWINKGQQDLICFTLFICGGP